MKPLMSLEKWKSKMSWMADVYQALKKVIPLEEKLSVMAEDVAKLSDKMVEIDRRLLKLETKLEVYEGIAKRREIN